MDGANIAEQDQNGIVNSIHSLISEISVRVNGVQVYNNTFANQTTNIKNILEYDNSYAKTTATNYFFILTQMITLKKGQLKLIIIKDLLLEKPFLELLIL